MKTIVTLCGSGWAQWSAMVRTRALDLYNSDEGVEFWDAVNPASDEQSIWGNWPRHVTLGGPALIAEFEEQIEKLKPQDRLAFLMVYPSPLAELADDASGSRRAARPPNRDDFIGLYQRQLASRPARGLQVLRVAVFDTAPAPDLIAAATSLVTDRVFDCAFFLVDDHGGGANESLRRRFVGLRILIDMAREGQGERAEHDLWRRMLRPVLGSLMPVWVLNVPGDDLIQDPSIRRAAEIACYFDRHTAERGQDSVGQSLKDLDALHQQIKDKILAAKNSVMHSSGLEISQDDDAHIQAKSAGFLTNATKVASDPPKEPNLRVTEQWQEAILGGLITFFNERRKRIRDGQISSDANSRRTEADIDATMQVALSAQRTGLTPNAYSKIMSILTELRQEKALFAMKGAGERDNIFNFIKQEGLDQDGYRQDGYDKIRSLPDYQEMLLLQTRFREATMDFVRFKRYALGIGGAILALYLMLLIHATTLADDPNVLSALLLELSVGRVSLLASFALAIAGVAGAIYFDTLKRWEARRDEITMKSEKIALQLEAVAENCRKYGKISAEMSWMSITEQRLQDRATEINEPLIVNTIDLLRPGGAAAVVTAEEERVFNNVLAERLIRTPVNRWIQVMLDRVSPEPVTEIELTFADDRSGSLAVASRLGVGQPVTIIRAVS